MRRLRMRSWRRGMREMDLILGSFADAELSPMTPAERGAYEALIEENDQSLFAWVTGSESPPERHYAMLRRLRAFHGLG